MAVDDLSRETVIVDGEGRRFGFVDDESHFVEVCFRKGRGDVDMFLLCCSVALAQDICAANRCVTDWKGADVRFLIAVGEHYGWPPGFSSLGTYWVDFRSGADANAHRTDILVDGARPQSQANLGKTLFQRQQGCFFLGPRQNMPRGEHTYWLVQFPNKTAETDALEDFVSELLTCTKTPTGIQNTSDALGVRSGTYADYLCPDFTGRELYLDEVKEHLRDPDFPSGYIVITGEPGIGKTALAAELVKRQDCVHHFNNAVANIRSPHAFLTNICPQLMQKCALKRTPIPTEAARDGRFLRDLLSEAAQKAPEGPIVIVVDALDEADDSCLPVRANRLFLPRDLPERVFFIVTMREKDDERLLVSNYRHVPVIEDDPRNQEDVRAYVHKFMAGHAPKMRQRVQEWKVSKEQFVDKLIRNSEGNFMYLHHVLRAIERGKFREGGVDELPHGLRAYYHCHWNQMRRGNEAEFERSHEPVIGILATTFEAVSVAQVAEITRVSARRVGKIFKDWWEFFHVERGPNLEKLHRLYHASYQDFLREEVDPDLKTYHKMIARAATGKRGLQIGEGISRVGEAIETAEVNEGDYVSRWHASPNKNYYINHLAKHLAAAGLRSELCSLLLQFRWMQAKLENTDCESLIGDYGLLPDDTTVQLLEECIRLSAHALTDDKGQLATQLTGRLLGNKDDTINAILSQIARHCGKPWLRPLRCSLTSPGGRLVRSIYLPDAMNVTLYAGKDRQWAVTRSPHCELRIWDLQTGREIPLPSECGSYPHAEAVSRDCRYAVLETWDGIADIRDLVTGELILATGKHKFPLGVNAFAVSQDRKVLVWSLSGGSLEFWDVLSGKILHRLPGRKGWIKDVTLSRDGKVAVSLADDKTMKVWNVPTGEQLYDVRNVDAIVEAWPDDSDVLYLSVNGILETFDVSIGEAIRIYDKIRGAIAVAMDAGKAFCKSSNEILDVYDLKTQERIHSFKADVWGIDKIAVTRDGKKPITSHHLGPVKVWDLDRETNGFPSEDHRDAVWAIDMTSSGKFAVTGSLDGTVKVWDIRSATLRHTLKGHSDYVTTVAAVPNSFKVISGSYDKTVRIWDIRSGEMIKILSGHAGKVQAVAVTSDGHHAVSGSDDKSIIVWDMETGKEHCRFIGHDGEIDTVAITADDRFVISGSADKTLRVWDLHTKQLERTIEEVEYAARSVIVIPGDEKVISMSTGQLQLWDLNTGELLVSFWADSHGAITVADTANGLMAMYGGGGMVMMLDIDKREIVDQLEGHRRAISTIATMHNADKVVSGGTDSTLRVWDIARRETVARFHCESRPQCCAVTPNGSTIIAGELSGRVHFLRLESGPQSGTAV